MATKKETKGTQVSMEACETPIDMEALKAQIIEQATAEARSQAAAIVAEAKEQVAEFVSPAGVNPHKETEEERAYYDELVPIRLFKDGTKYKDDVTVIHNGKAWLIQRGKDVEVPRKVAEILEQSAIQIGVAADVMSDYEKTYEAGKDQLTE